MNLKTVKETSQLIASFRHLWCMSEKEWMQNPGATNESPEDFEGCDTCTKMNELWNAIFVFVKHNMPRLKPTDILNLLILHIVNSCYPFCV